MWPVHQVVIFLGKLAFLSKFLQYLANGLTVLENSHAELLIPDTQNHTVKKELNGLATSPNCTQPALRYGRTPMQPPSHCDWM